MSDATWILIGNAAVVLVSSAFTWVRAREAATTARLAARKANRAAVRALAVKTAVDEVHTIVNSQKAALLAEIASLKQTILDMQTKAKP